MNFTCLDFSTDGITLVYSARKLGWSINDAVQHIFTGKVYFEAYKDFMQVFLMLDCKDPETRLRWFGWIFDHAKRGWNLPMVSEG